MKKTFAEILEILEEKIINVEKFAHEYFDESDLNLGEIKLEAKYGGSDKGSTWYRVFLFVEHDIYIRVDGWYSSGNGVDFDGWSDCSEVRPTEKTIVVYE